MPNMRDIVTQESSNFGINPIVPLTIMNVESGGNYRAKVLDTNGQYSYGLFQLNASGLGKGYTEGQLLNPTINTDIALKAMQPWYQKGVSQGMNGEQLIEYVANNAGWPGNLGVAKTQMVEPQYDKNLQNVYNKLAPQYNQNTQNLQNATGPNVLTKAGQVLGSQTTGAIPGNITDWLNKVNWKNTGVIIGGSLLIVLLLYRVVTK